MKKIAIYLLTLAVLSIAACTQLPTPASSGYLPADFCYLDDVAPQVRVELMYAGTDNFVGRPLAGYCGSRAILRRDTAAAVARAVELLAAEGIGLLVKDAYRPAQAMRDFYAWSKTPDRKMQHKYYPNISKKGIYEDQYIGTTSEHSWGIAVDVTLIDLSTGQELDMGGHVDLLDPSSATDYPNLTPTQKRNRRKLRNIMASVGMRNYSKEWWHYFLSPSGLCRVYSFPIRDNLSEQRNVEETTLKSHVGS